MTSRARAAVDRPGRRNEVDQAEEVAEVGGTWLARLGLAGRGGFYALLTYLTIRLALSGSTPHQANASGAMATVAHPIVGKVLLGAIALGLFALGVESLVGACRDRERGWPHRAMAACRGAFYLAIAYIPCSFLAGNRQTGSEQEQQRTTGRILGLAFGQELLVAVGLVVVGVCVWQVYSAVRQKP